MHKLEKRNLSDYLSLYNEENEEEEKEESQREYLNFEMNEESQNGQNNNIQSYSEDLIK